MSSIVTRTLAAELEQLGYPVIEKYYFDTIRVRVKDVTAIRSAATARGMNFYYSGPCVGISIDETTSQEDIVNILAVFGHAASHGCIRVPATALQALSRIPLGTPVMITS